MISDDVRAVGAGAKDRRLALGLADDVMKLEQIVRAADVMIRHKNSPKWADGLIPWREIAEGVDVDDLIALAEALEALPEHLRGK